MNEETIVAVYDTAEHAAAAVRDLESAGVPSSAISQHAGSSTGLAGSSATGMNKPREQGFWASLFGGEPEYEHDTAVYDRSLQGGSTVVTVRGSSEHLTQVLDVLERHNPIDIDERAASYGLAAGAAGERPIPSVQTENARTAGMAGTTGMAGTAEPGTLQLSEEQLVVGKRAVNRGTTRVRRYVVETPVEEQVSLHEERVTVERRPVTGDRPVSDADFSDKVIEVTETGEEAVVGKQARVREEVVIRKEGAERTETVRDTVRREDVEITKDGSTNLTGTGTGTTASTVGAGATTERAGTTGATGTTTGAGTATTSPYKPAV